MFTRLSYFIFFLQTSSFTYVSGFANETDSSGQASQLKLNESVGNDFNSNSFCTPEELQLRSDLLRRNLEEAGSLQLFHNEQFILDGSVDSLHHEGLQAEESHSCPTCQKSFRRLWHLKRHMTTHLSTRPFVCPYCGYGLNVKDKLRLHLIKMHPNLPMPDLYGLKMPS